MNKWALLIPCTVACQNPSFVTPPIPLSADGPTRLDFSSQPWTDRNAEQHPVLENMAMRFSDSGSVVWQVNAPEAGLYEVHLSYASIGAGTEVSIHTDADDISGTLKKSKGPFWEHLSLETSGDANMNQEFLLNYSRNKVPGQLHLDAGVQEVHLDMKRLPRGETIDLRTMELVPVGIQAELDAEAEDAELERADTAWFQDSTYGIMVHWTDLTINADGSALPYPTAVDRFDVVAFADLMEELGAGHVLFTLNHQFPHCPAPIPEWEAIHPGWTTERDLIADLIEELDERDIPLMLYVASHLVGRPDGVGEPAWLRAHEWGRTTNLQNDDHFDIIENNKTVLSAIGARYGTGVAGFWLDGWDLIPETYPHGDFSEIFDAAKVGHPDRLVSFNRWIFPTVTPWQDYWAGEVDSPDRAPGAEIIQEDAGKGLLYHSLLAVENDWVYTAEGQDYGRRYFEPRYKVGELARYVDKVKEQGGAVTINLAIRQDLSLDEDTRALMVGLKERVQ
jgi:hypothetical protein